MQRFAGIRRFRAPLLLAALALLLLAGAYAYTGCLERRLCRRLEQLETAACEASSDAADLAAVLMAANGMRLAADTAGRFQSMLDPTAEPTALAISEAAALAGFIAENQQRLLALRSVLAAGSAPGGAKLLAFGDTEAALATWAWRLLAVAALLGGGDAEQSMADMAGAMRLYRALSALPVFEARGVAVEIIERTLVLAQRLRLSAAEGIGTVEALARLEALVQAARQDAAGRWRSANRLLEAAYYRRALEAGRAAGMFTRLFFYHSIPAAPPATVNDAGILDWQAREARALEYLAAGLAAERRFILDGRYPDALPAGYRATVSNSGPRTIRLRLPEDAEDGWRMYREPPHQPE